MELTRHCDLSVMKSTTFFIKVVVWVIYQIFFTLIWLFCFFLQVRATSAHWWNLVTIWLLIWTTTTFCTFCWPIWIWRQLILLWPSIILIMLTWFNNFFLRIQLISLLFRHTILTLAVWIPRYHFNRCARYLLLFRFRISK